MLGISINMGGTKTSSSLTELFKKSHERALFRERSPTVDRLPDCGARLERVSLSGTHILRAVGGSFPRRGSVNRLTEPT
jgi:hypothetical protein